DLDVDVDVDAHGIGASNLDAPGSPMDDSDDDFYETAPAVASASAAEAGGPPPSAVAAEPACVASSQIPGLGLWSEPSAAQTSAQTATPIPDGEEGLEDGELSDDESFYSEAKPGVSVTPNPQATGGVPQQSKRSQPGCPSAFSPTVDGPEKPVVTTATLNVPNGTPPTLQPQGSPGAEAHDATDAPPATATAPAQEDEGKTEFLQAAAANKDNKDAEWQLDSEASDSDSSSGSSSPDSSSDEGEDSDGELLSPEEALKLMMAEDPDDPEPSKDARVKTQNELDEVFEKPDIKMQDDTKITELGKVESVVENMVVIKGNTPGDHQVLESGSALCLENRTVIGQVSEAIGRVQDPRYSVGFTDPAEIGTLDITKGTPIYYVNEHSTLVDTEPLRTEKHTDASGQYDEEARVQEFSDDEQEAAHKREQKRERQIKRGDLLPETHPEPPRGPASDRNYGGRPQPAPYTGGALKYSDDDDDEDLGMYKPLARPDRFEEVVGNGAPIEDRSHVRRGMMRGGRGGWQDRGRGFRGRGGRGDRGGMSHGGRGDRGGMSHGGRGDRGGAFRGQPDRGDRSFRGQSDRGDRSNRGHSDRGRHQEQNRGRGGAQRDHANNRRSANSPPAASPPRQPQGHQQPQQSPARGNKKRKRNRNTSEARSSQPPAAANANAYASNNTQSNPAWNAPSTQTSSVSAAYAPPAPTAPAYAPPAPYANPAFYPQAAAAAPVADQAQWAQWYQLAQAISQAQSAQQQAAPPPPPPQIQQQPQTQYQYPYQYQQNAAPTPDPRRAATQVASQPVGSSLSDILRALGNANQGT
ncbi:NAF1-domain-containing protein, partial [Lentithecium fluviatile CBS 122367]